MAPRTAHGATAGVRQQLASETQFHRVQTRDANRCRGMTSVRSKRASRPDEELRGGGHCSLCTCTYTLSELPPTISITTCTVGLVALFVFFWSKSDHQTTIFHFNPTSPPDLTSILVSRPSGQRTFHPAHGATTSLTKGQLLLLLLPLLPPPTTTTTTTVLLGRIHPTVFACLTRPREADQNVGTRG